MSGCYSFMKRRSHLVALVVARVPRRLPKPLYCWLDWGWRFPDRKSRQRITIAMCQPGTNTVPWADITGKAMDLRFIGLCPSPQWDPRKMRKTASFKRTLASGCFFKEGDRRAHMAPRTRMFSKGRLGTDIEYDDDLGTTLLREACSSWVEST